MTRKQALIRLTELTEVQVHCTSYGNFTCPHSAIIFFRDPITDTVEERHMWASSIMELEIWLNYTLPNYKAHDISYVAYIDGGIAYLDGDFCVNGILFKESDLEDE